MKVNFIKLVCGIIVWGVIFVSLYYYNIKKINTWYTLSYTNASWDVFLCNPDTWWWFWTGDITYSWWVPNVIMNKKFNGTWMSYFVYCNNSCTKNGNSIKGNFHSLVYDDNVFDLTGLLFNEDKNRINMFIEWNKRGSDVIGCQFYCDEVLLLCPLNIKIQSDS